MDPYIGITDFTHFDQVWSMQGLFKFHLPNGSRHKLHVGVMTSYKKLHGLPTKWQHAFPPLENIAGIFASDETYNCLHYADYGQDPEFTKSLAKALWHGGMGIHAVQLDMIWPDPGQIAEGVHRSRKRVEVILQIGRKAFDAVQNNPEALIAKLADYEGVIQRVLLDKSGGEGRGMDAVGLMIYARAIRERFPQMGLGAAGGLGPETMHLAEPLAKTFPDISIDAQSRLRPSGSALDPVDWGMAAWYLVEAIKIFG
ncbi:MAG: hypothetical protein Q8Q39_00680 [bacterium]|nr:hypothetical protein [bacterium]